MNKRLGEITLRDVELMSRAKVVDSLMQISQFFPVSPDRTSLEAMPEVQLRQLLNRARRKLHGLGY